LNVCIFVNNDLRRGFSQIHLVKKDFNTSSRLTLILLKAVITNIDEWKAILTAISDVVEDAIFICTDDGITFRGIDSSQMALLDITFPRSSFKKLTSNTSFFGLKIKDFSKIMNFASSNDIVEFQKSQKNSNENCNNRYN